MEEALRTGISTSRAVHVPAFNNDSETMKILVILQGEGRLSACKNLLAWVSTYRTFSAAG
jgi:hypothetical protein